MSTLITIFNFIAWVVGAPIVMAAILAVMYELGVLLLEGLRVRLRRNKRFMAWLDRMAEDDRAEDDLISAYTTTEVHHG